MPISIPATITLAIRVSIDSQYQKKMTSGAIAPEATVEAPATDQLRPGLVLRAGSVSVARAEPRSLSGGENAALSDTADARLPFVNEVILDSSFDMVYHPSLRTAPRSPLSRV